MRRRKVRWAVVGLGRFAEGAILPAFRHVRHAELVAVVSGDEKKRRKLARQHHARIPIGYDGYRTLLASGDIDAVYIALPNHLHREYAVAAADAAVNVLVEKPMAVTGAECDEIIAACDRQDVKLMVGYRLLLERGTRAALDFVHAGKIGEPRVFSSVFTFQVRPGNVRVLPRAQGGGPLYDIGIYCINAARNFFRAEPIEVTALTATQPGDARFGHVEEQIGAVLRFPDDRVATFTVGLGAEHCTRYSVLGTLGALHMDDGYSYTSPLVMHTDVGGRRRTKRFRHTDHLAAEIAHFSECVLKDREPIPSAQEGLADVRVIEAIYRSVASGRPEVLRS